VKDFSTFWVKQSSTAVRVKRASSLTTPAPTITSSPASTGTKKPLQSDIQSPWQSTYTLIFHFYSLIPFLIVCAKGILGLPSPGQVTSAKTELKTRTLLLAQLLLKEVGRGKSNDVNVHI
jgi:hypothetical protein